MAFESDNIHPTSGTENSVAFIVVTEPVKLDQPNQEQGNPVGFSERDLGQMQALCVEYSGHPVSAEASGLQIIFPSAEQSLNWARAIQKYAQQIPADQRTEQRIGIHQGEVFIDRKVLQGEGLDVALLLKSKAPAGGICVSSTVVELLADPSQFHFEELSDWDGSSSVGLPKKAYLINAAPVVKKKEERMGDSSLHWICLIGFSAAAFLILLIIRNYLSAGYVHSLYGR